MFVCCFAVTADADSIYDTAKAISSGKTYSTKILSDGDYIDYKINVSQKGELSIKVKFEMAQTYIFVLDDFGGVVKRLGVDSTSGEFHGGYDYAEWNSKTEVYSGTLRYEVGSGTYYIRIKRGEYVWNKGSGNITFTANFPSKSTSSNAFAGIGFSMKVGKTMQLYIMTSGELDSTPVWSSSDKSVATVSSNGKVKAKKDGVVSITVKIGKQKSVVYIIVE